MTDFKEKEKAGPSDRYVPLNSLKVHTKVDVYGVVKFFKQPYKSRGSDYCTMISLVDASYTDPMDKLKCLLFARELGKLPQVKLGHIIRFHRLGISEYMGSLQGQSSPGFSWLLFPGDVGAPLEPLKASSDTYTITNVDREMVQKLRSWANSKDELHEKLCFISEIAVGAFFDLVCQVVYTSVTEDGVARLFKVWDGTQCLYEVRNVSSDFVEQGVQKDDSLVRKAKGFIYDVCVFDDHFRTSKNIKPGDYVKFINLHAAEYKSPNNRDSMRPMVEFVLHRGDAFGRSVRVLPPDDADLETMKHRQSILAMENDSIDLSESMQESSNSPEVVEVTKEQEPVPSTSRKPVPSTSREPVPSTSWKPVPSTSREPIPSTSRKPVPSTSREPVPSTSREPVPSTSREPVPSTSRKPVPSTSRKPDQTSKESNCVRSNQETECVTKTTVEIANGQINEVSDHRDEEEEEEGNRKRPRTDPEGTDPEGNVNDKGTGQQSLTESEPTCMVQTSTVVISHPSTKRSKIADVLEFDVPYKFRVRARVIDYHPKPDSVRRFIKLYCSECHYLCSHPGADCNENNRSDTELQVGSTFKGVPHYNCPQCLQNQDSLRGFDSPPHLQYIYMLRFLLRDDSGMLMANIWKEEAVKFFQDTEPEDLLKDASQLEQIRECLNQICPVDKHVEERPLVECCLRSYSVAQGTGYQIFDTVVV